jgi:hypothetical protein
MTQYSIAVLAGGAAIFCEPSVDLNHSIASETYVPGNTLH